MEDIAWEVGAATYKESPVKNFKWLPKEHLVQLKQLLDHLGLGNHVNGTIMEQNAAELTMGIGTRNESNFTMQVVKLDNRTKVEIISGESVPFFARLYHNNNEKNADGTHNQHLVVIEDGEIIIDEKEPTITNEVETPNIIEFLRSATPSDGISVQAWYDDIPCMGNGCCIFHEPAWTGGPLIPVPYKWCGAKCGSGTPINALDTCCRTHDYCYGSFSSYPARCSCDQNLINCSSGKPGYGPPLIRTAFRIKMNSNNC